MIPGSNAWYEPPTAGPCVCGGEYEEHETVFANNAASPDDHTVCHHAAECECTEYREYTREDRDEDAREAAAEMRREERMGR